MMADADFEDIFDAYKQLGKLYTNTKSPDKKQSIKRIKNTLDLGLRKITAFGVKAGKRFEEVRQKWPD
jgi:hypothetical protein